MSVSDRDLELLEELLDAPTAAPEGAAQAEPAATAALEQLRSARSARAVVWAALEPSDADVDRFVQRVTSAIQRDEVRRLAKRPWRFAAAVAAVAACAAIGFSSGWALRGRRLPAQSTAPLASAQGKVAPGVEAVVTYQVALTDDKGHVTAVQNFDSLEQAREFASDVGQWQQRRQQMRDGAAVIVADQY